MDRLDRLEGREQLKAGSGLATAESLQVDGPRADELSFEQLLSELSCGLGDSSTDRIDRELEVWMRRIAEFLNVDRCLVWRSKGEGTHLVVTHSWAKLGLEHLSEPWADADLTWLAGRIEKSETLIFFQVSDFPDEAVNERKWFQEFGPRTTIVIRLAVGGSTVGAMAFGAVHETCVNSSRMLQRLKLFGQVFAAAIIRMQGELLLRKEVQRRHLLLELYERAVRLTDKELYGFVLERAVELTDSAIGFFHLVSDDQQTISLTAWNSEALKSCSTLYETHYPIGQAGNWVDCVRLKRPLIYNDFPNSPNQKGLPDGHSPVRRFMSIPVMEGDKVRIVLGVGNKIDEYDDSDIGQIQLVANELQRIIKHRRFDEALRENEKRFRLLYERAPLGYQSLDADGRLIDVNQAWLDTLGYTRDEVIGHWIGKFLSPDQIDLLSERFPKFVAEGEIHGYEFNMIRKDGSLVIAAFDGRIGYDENGQFRQTHCILSNVTERKRAEDAARRKNEYLTALHETTLELISQFDLDQLLENILKRAGQLVGATAGYLDLLEPGATRLTPKVGLGVLVESLKFSVQQGEGLTGRVWASGQPLVVDDYDAWPGRIKDHAYGLIRSIIGIPLLSKSGVMGVLGLAYDRKTERKFDQESMELLSEFARFTAIAIENARLFSTATLELAERKQAEEALRQSEDKFSRIFQSSPNIIVISTAEEGRIIEINDSGARALGYTREEMIGRTPEELGLVTPGARESFLEALGERGLFTNLEKTMKDRSGREIAGLFSGQAITIGDQQVLFLTIVDITERKQFGAMLRFAVEGTSATVGKNFFHPLVKHLATALKMRYALIGELSPDKSKIVTRATWIGGRIGKQTKYSLEGTPCSKVVGETMQVYSSNVRSLFPEDKILAKSEFESYLGTPLFSSAGEPLGILVVMDNKPFPEAVIPHAKSLVSIFAARAAAELERLKIEDELKGTSERLRTEREELAEKNIALRQILDHLERRKEDYKHQVSSSVESLLTPFVEKLRRSGGHLKVRDIDLFENALNSIIDEGLDEFSSNYGKLSPREVDICERIRKGMSSKEIAKTLNIDVQTVHKHRDSIRRKLQLKHTNLNLAVYLRSR